MRVARTQSRAKEGKGVVPMVAVCARKSSGEVESRFETEREPAGWQAHDLGFRVRVSSPSSPPTSPFVPPGRPVAFVPIAIFINVGLLLLWVNSIKDN